MRPSAVRRGGPLTVTIGFLGIGLSAAVLLAAGPRLLGHASFSGLGIVWTIASVFGFGIATPTEQVLTRRLNLVAGSGVRRPLIQLGLAAIVVAVACWLFASHTSAASQYRALVPSAILAVLGWTILVYVRGRLAGAGDLRAYSVVLATETASRVALVGVAYLIRGHAEVVTGAAVGVPLLAAAAVGAVFRIPPLVVVAADPAPPAATENAVEQLSFMMISLGFQACLNAPPLLTEWRSGAAAPAAVGAFVAANSYFRTPTVLMGGISTHALVELSHSLGVGMYERFRAAAVQSLRRIILVSGLATGLASAAAPFLLKLYYGSDLGLPILMYAALATSSVLAVVAVVAMQPLMATGHGRTAATLWTIAAVATLAVVADSNGRDAVASAGLLVGPVIALVGGIFSLTRLLRRQAVVAPVRAS